ncbi:hypothetical protein [Desulfatibacillum aliphaticivorans]|uniref:hypothetical protein n=1 Tax=Desulfatibacillum aliphaticivorans TaxID=218208 RepID=UPI00041E592A|nr:hypothetical protein [Desulfatibacillum aliphaticivorans]
MKNRTLEAMAIILAVAIGCMMWGGCGSTRIYKTWCRNEAPRNADVVNYATGETVMIADGYDKDGRRHCQAVVVRGGKYIPLQFRAGYVYEGSWEVYNYRLYTPEAFEKLKDGWSKRNLAVKKVKLPDPK